MGRSSGRCCSERDLKDQQCHSKTRVSSSPLLGLDEMKSHWCPPSKVQLQEQCLAPHGLAKIPSGKKRKKEEGEMGTGNKAVPELW